MRVPAEAANGKAKIRLSFEAWKEGKVAPAEFDIAVTDPPKPDPASLRSGD